jgi:hypothetical protein
MQSFLSLLVDCENLNISLLTHVLISLSYLSKDRFKPIKEQCKFNEKLGEFTENIKKMKTSKLFFNEDERISENDRKSILELYTTMFSASGNSKGKVNNVTDDQELIYFECFNDEIN